MLFALSLIKNSLKSNVMLSKSIFQTFRNTIFLKMLMTPKLRYIHLTVKQLLFITAIILVLFI